MLWVFSMIHSQVLCCKALWLRRTLPCDETEALNPKPRKTMAATL